MSLSGVFAKALFHHFTTRELDLGGAILSLQIVAGMNPDRITSDADINGDGDVGLAKAVYGLQKEAGFK